MINSRRPHHYWRGPCFCSLRSKWCAAYKGKFP